MGVKSCIPKAKKADDFKQLMALYKKALSFIGDERVHEFNQYTKERYMFEDLLKLLKETSPEKETVMAKTPVSREHLIIKERYACKHFRKNEETDYYAVYFLGMQGDHAFVGHHHSIYKVAVNTLYTIQA